MIANIFIVLQALLSQELDDMTRTIFVGYVREEYRKIYDLVLKNQELVIKLNTYGFTVKEAIDLINDYGMDILNIINDDIGLKLIKIKHVYN